MFVLFLILAIISSILFYIFKDNANQYKHTWYKTRATIKSRDIEPNSVRYFATCSIKGKEVEACSIAYTYKHSKDIYPQESNVDIEYHTTKSGKIIFRITNCKHQDLSTNLKWLSIIFLIASALFLALAIYFLVHH